MSGMTGYGNAGRPRCHLRTTANDKCQRLGRVMGPGAAISKGMNPDGAFQPGARSNDRSVQLP